MRRVVAVFVLVLGCGASGSEDDGGASSESGTSTTSSSSGGADSSSGTTGEALQLCGLEDLKPGAPNPIVSGDGAMQIPSDIGDILVRSCGCHLADDLAVDVMFADYPDAAPMQLETWEQWQGTYPGSDIPLTEIVRGRVAPDAAAQMPPPACNTGDGESMLPEDRTTLLAWIDAGAPDGATWVP